MKELPNGPKIFLKSLIDFAQIQFEFSVATFLGHTV